METLRLILAALREAIETNTTVGERFDNAGRTISRIYAAIVIITLILASIGYACNYFGCPVANAVIAILMMVAMIYVGMMFSPEIMAGYSGLSLLDVVRKKINPCTTTLPTEVRDNIIVMVVSRYFLYVSLYFFFASVHSFKFNPGGALIIILGFIVLCWMDVAWKYDPRLFKPFAFAYVGIIIVWAVAISIQPVSYVGFCGYDVVSSLRPSANEDQANSVISAANNVEREVAITQLDNATKAYKAKPTPEALEEMKKAQENLSKLGATNKFLQSFNSGKKEAASTSASAAPAPIAQSALQVAATSTAHYGEPDRNNVRIITADTDMPLPAGRGQTTNCWYKIKANGFVKFWSDNENFAVVTMDGRQYRFWDFASIDAFNKATLNVPFYVKNEADQAANITARIRFT